MTQKSANIKNQKLCILIAIIPTQGNSEFAELLKVAVETNNSEISCVIDNTSNAVESALLDDNIFHVIIVFDSPANFVKKAQMLNLTSTEAMKQWYQSSVDTIKICRDHQSKFTMINSSFETDKIMTICEILNDYIKCESK